MGYGVFLFFLGAAKIIKARDHRGVAIAHILMGTSLFAGIILDIIRAFFLSEASEKTLWIIDRLDANITGYFLGLVTFYLLCIKVEKKDKTPIGIGLPIAEEPSLTTVRHKGVSR
jgi:hypothetical protein